MSRPDISIIMPTKDRGAIFRRSYETLITQTEGLAAELIFVNDSKTEDLMHLAKPPRVTVVNNPGQGVASARNEGARRAAGRVLLFIDDDIVTNRAAIDATVAFHENHPRSVYNPNWVYPPELTERLHATQFGRFLIQSGHTSLRGWFGSPGWRDGVVFEVAGCASYHLSLDVDLFHEVGGFDERFPNAGLEDMDFTRRLAKTGARFFIDGTQLVYHNEVDKIVLENWLKRYYHASRNRRIAYDLGYADQAVRHGAVKSMIYKAIARQRRRLISLLKAIPNEKRFDRLYGISIRALLGSAIFEGYHSAARQ